MTSRDPESIAWIDGVVWGRVVSDGLVLPAEAVVPTGADMEDYLAPVTLRRPPAVEDLIDRAIASLCPCGAEPSDEFFPYCSWDCKPTHRVRRTPTFNEMEEYLAEIRQIFSRVFDQMQGLPEFCALADGSMEELLLGLGVQVCLLERGLRCHCPDCLERLNDPDDHRSTT